MGNQDGDLTEGASYWHAVGKSWADDGRSAVWRRHDMEVHAALLRQWLPKTGLDEVLITDLFDEAIGNGLYPEIAKHAKNVTGIDIAPSVVSAASENQPALKTKREDVRELSFEACRFDCTFSKSTLDHFDSERDITTALGELYRTLKPGGSLIVTLDNEANPAVWLRNALPHPFLRALGLVPYRTGISCGPARFRTLLRKAGFHIDEMAAILHCPRAPAVGAAAVIQRMGGARLKRLFLDGLRAFEELVRLPTRFRTGYYIAALARKPRDAGSNCPWHEDAEADGKTGTGDAASPH